MATDAKKPRSILRKTPTQRPTAADPKEIALQHAKILQHQRDLEAQILESVITLSEYPVVRTAPYNAANPAPSDIAGFKSHVRLFQPSDYDDLIEERNVNDLCGYTLCSKPRRQTGPGGEWKLSSSGEIVKRRELEKWCSQQCARRAFYVKVQLNETAAWERAGILDIEIDLLDEDKSTETDVARTAREMGDLKLEDQRQAARDAAALALERGERSTMTLSANKRLNIMLKEKDVSAPGEIKAQEQPEDDHLRIEGYKTKPQNQETDK